MPDDEQGSQPDEAQEPEEELVEIGPDAPGASIGEYLFDKWDPSEVTLHDRGLARYVTLTGHFSVHTGARHANKKFGKADVNVIERFINQLMRTDDYTGKKTKAIRVVEDTFDHIHETTGDNPLQVFVDALQNAAPREEVTRLRYGGISVPKAVDTAPSRRVDWALRNLAQGTIDTSYKNSIPVHECLARELLQAADGSPDSYAVGRRDEVERVAGSAR